MYGIDRRVLYKQQPFASMTDNKTTTNQIPTVRRGVLGTVSPSYKTFSPSKLSILNEIKEIKQKHSNQIGIRKQLQIDESYELIRNDRLKYGPNQRPSLPFRFLRDYKFHRRAQNSYFVNLPNLNIDGITFTNVTVPYVIVPGSESQPCTQLGWCKSRIVNHTLSFDLCPRHVLATSFTDAPPHLSTPTTGFMLNVANTVFESNNYQHQGHKIMGDSNLDFISPVSALEIIEQTFLYGDCTWHKHEFTLKCFPSYYEASTFYDELSTIITKYDDFLVINPVLLSIMLTGIKTNSITSLVFFERLTERLTETMIQKRTNHVCIKSTPNDTLAHFLTNGFTHKPKDYFMPFEILARQPYNFTPLKSNPSMPEEWKTHVRSLSERWTTNAAQLTTFPSGGAMVTMDSNHFMCHAAQLSCLEMWDQLIHQPTEIKDWNTVLRQHFVVMLRGGGRVNSPKTKSRVWKPKSNASSIIGGIKFPEAKIFNENSGHNNRCGAYCVYQILRTLFPKEFTIKSDSIDGLNRQYSILQEAASFSGFELENELLSADSVVALLFAFGVRAVIYTPAMINDAPRLLPVLSSSRAKAFTGSKQKIPVQNIVLTTNIQAGVAGEIGHYSVLTKNSWKFHEKINDATVHFDPITKLILPSSVNANPKEFNPKTKKFEPTKRPLLPFNTDFSDEWVALSYKNFCDHDLATVYSCGKINNQVVRVLPRDVFLSTDQGYPLTWKNEDLELHKNLADALFHCERPRGPFSVMLGRIIEEGFASKFLGLAPLPTSDQTDAMDAFLTPKKEVKLNFVDGEKLECNKFVEEEKFSMSEDVLPTYDEALSCATLTPVVPPKPSLDSFQVVKAFTKNPPPLPPKPIKQEFIPDIEYPHFIENLPLPPFSTHKDVIKERGVIFRMEDVGQETPILNFLAKCNGAKNRYKHAVSYYTEPVLINTINKDEQRIIAHTNDKNIEESQLAVTTIHHVIRRRQQLVKNIKETRDTWKNRASKILNNPIKAIALLPVSLPALAVCKAIQLVNHVEYEYELVNSYKRTSQRVVFENNVIRNLPAVVDFTGKSDSLAPSIIQSRVKVTAPFVNTMPRVAYGLDEFNTHEGTQAFSQVYYHSRRLVANMTIESCKGALSTEVEGTLYNIHQ